MTLSTGDKDAELTRVLPMGRYLWELMRRRRKSGVPFSPHDLRRTFASIVSRLGDRLSYYTTKRLLNHRTSDVTQGYVQFDLEQLRSAMQAVEDFVLQKVKGKPGHDTHVLDVKDLPSQPYVGRVTSSMPQGVDGVESSLVDTTPAAH